MSHPGRLRCRPGYRDRARPREPSPMDSAPTPGQTVAEVWQAHHRYLVNLAARMLHDRSAAEDVVQEAFGRLTTTQLDEIDEVRGWLTVIVRRLCLNRLHSAYNRREAAVGTSPPEASGPGTA